MGNIGLFTGIETANWSMTQFDELIAFCHQHKVTQIVLKIYEITQGEWYLQHGGSRNVVDHIKTQGIDVLPYGFYYGNNTVEEARMTSRFLDIYGRYCMNMESAFDNQPGKVQQLVDGIKPAMTTGKVLWISTWANPESHGWLKNIEILNALGNVVYMPECYDDFLVKEMYAQYPRMTQKIKPTFHITQTSSSMAKPYSDFTVWEYTEAGANPAKLQEYVTIMENNNTTTDYVTQQANDIWNSSLVKPRQGTGIYNSWLKAFKLGFQFGPAYGNEFTTVDETGKPMQVQYFVGGIKCEWPHDGKAYFHDIHGNMVWYG